METVKVVVNIPGLLEKGDILTSASEGEDFTMFVKDGNFERSATIDYYSVCANIPTYFVWELDEQDMFEEDLLAEAVAVDDFNREPDGFYMNRTATELAERYKFFQDKVNTTPNWEEKVVYSNLIWFVDWLTGNRELL